MVYKSLVSYHNGPMSRLMSLDLGSIWQMAVKSSKNSKYLRLQLLQLPARCYVITNGKGAGS